MHSNGKSALSTGGGLLRADSRLGTHDGLQRGDGTPSSSHGMNHLGLARVTGMFVGHRPIIYISTT
jgi:hypothetical protein